MKNKKIAIFFSAVFLSMSMLSALNDNPGEIVITGTVLSKANQPVQGKNICLAGYSKPDPLAGVRFDGVFHRDACATTDKKGIFKILVTQDVFSSAYEKKEKLFLAILTKKEYVVLYNSEGNETGLYLILPDTCMPILEKDKERSWLQAEDLKKGLVDIGPVILDENRAYKAK
jgi:hypothetical protein